MQIPVKSLLHPTSLLLLLVLAGLLAGCGGSASAGTPAEIQLFRSWAGTTGSVTGATDDLILHWAHWDDALGQPLYRLFDELGGWTEADVGTTRVLERGDTLDFDLFEQHVTNGQDDRMRIALRIADDSNVGISWFAQESERFIEVEPGVLQPDATGYRLTRIEVVLESATIDSPGQDRNGDGRWTDFSCRFELTFYGYRLP